MTSTVLLVDAIGGDSHNIPATQPVAGYLTGDGIAWTSAEWGRFTSQRVRILQQWTFDLTLLQDADVLDVEHGALTLTDALSIASHRKRLGLATTVYISAANLTAARNALKSLGSAVTFWVANWNLTQAEARALIAGDIVAIQYASPTSNPGRQLPHTNLTIRQANVDLSIASEQWLTIVNARWPKPTPTPAPVPAPAPAPKPAKKKITIAKPHPKTTAGTIGAAAIAGATAYAKTKGIHLTGADTTLLTATGAFITATITPVRKKG